MKVTIGLLADRAELMMREWYLKSAGQMQGFSAFIWLPLAFGGISMLNKNQ
jgi:hypothetical protein